MSSGFLSDLVQQVTAKAVGPKPPTMRYVGLEHIVKGHRVLLNSAPSSFSDGTNGMFEPGDILFGKLRPNLRKSVWVATTGFCSTDLLVLRPIEGVEPRFAAHVASSEVVFNQAERHSFGTKMPRTSWRAVAQSVVFVPPLDEQRRIAEILDAIDETIQATERVIAKLDSLRVSVLQRTVWASDGARKRLAELAHGRRGMTIGPFGSDLVAEDYRSSGVPVYFVRDVASGGHVKHNAQVFVSPEKAQRLRAHETRPGDILVTKMGLPPGVAALHDDGEQPGVIEVAKANRHRLT